MTSNPDLTAKYEEERLRTHEQSQIVSLQGQIDELRRLIKDQTNKYNWTLEQVRKTEALVVQVQSLFEQHREEIAQSIETSRRDIISVRKEVSSALMKIDEIVKPMRDMQAQIQQLAEARKQDRDQVFGWFKRLEDSEQHILSLQAELKQLDERQRQLAMQNDRLRDADALVAQEARKVGEELQVEKQNLRRQAVEAQQLVTDVHSILEEHSSRINHIDEIRQRVELFTDTLPVQIVELTNKLPDIAAEIKRVERISTERFLMNQERLEELRGQSEDKVATLQETEELHLRQMTSWLERIDSIVREIEQRLTRSTTRLENVQHQHISRIIELERRELQTLDMLMNVLQGQLEATRVAHLEGWGDEDSPA